MVVDKKNTSNLCDLQVRHVARSAEACEIRDKRKDLTGSISTNRVMCAINSATLCVHRAVTRHMVPRPS